MKADKSGSNSLEIFDGLISCGITSRYIRLKRLRPTGVSNKNIINALFIVVISVDSIFIDISLEFFILFKVVIIGEFILILTRTSFEMFFFTAISTVVRREDMRKNGLPNVSDKIGTYSSSTLIFLQQVSQ